MKTKIVLLVVAIFLSVPKISIIEVSGYPQGIRVEDFILLAISFFLAFAYKKIKLYSNKLVTILVYLLLVSLFSYGNGISQQWITLIRVAEYLVLYIFIFNSHIDMLLLKNILIINILINFLISIGQYNGLIGGFASFSYLESGHGWLERPYGVYGGPWELGVICVISIFCIRKIGCSRTILFILNALVLCMLILANTRANLIGYIVAISYLYRRFIFRKIIIISFGILILCFSLSDSLLIFTRLDSVLELILGVVKNYQTGVEISKVIGLDKSLYNRLDLWLENYEIWRNSILSMIIGIGWHSLYMESLYLRVLFSFGVVGICVLLIYSKNICRELIIFTMISGLTLDIFLSMRSAFIYMIFFYVVKKINESITNELENNNLLGARFLGRNGYATTKSFASLAK
ncbi:hypothetical protein ICN35_08755 [Polynucleobacter sp. es-GGE-1]|uniref:hypothetical protein n=1 Tax=Polynucleobacter sp. es-GGE-1 TaxID=1819724 RepID=UPI001C0C1B83|nr:hypothetical protein [Polynucleobacter sp. es-GGE-1]MBU3635548.1 hypothetical protein [Polynucleobacter sp. es-GGE-1]